MSVSERDTGSYAEEFRSSMQEATPIKEVHSRSATKQQQVDHNQVTHSFFFEKLTEFPQAGAGSYSGKYEYSHKISHRKSIIYEPQYS